MHYDLTNDRRYAEFLDDIYRSIFIDMGKNNRSLFIQVDSNKTRSLMNEVLVNLNDVKNIQSVMNTSHNIESKNYMNQIYYIRFGSTIRQNVFIINTTDGYFEENMFWKNWNENLLATLTHRNKNIKIIIIFDNESKTEENILYERKIFKTLKSTGFRHKFSHYIITETPEELRKLNVESFTQKSILPNLQNIMKNHIIKQTNNLGYALTLKYGTNIIRSKISQNTVKIIENPV